MNKILKKHIYKISFISLMTGILGLYTQCVPETQKIIAIDSSPYHAPSAAPITDQGALLSALEVSEGVRSYEEVFATYSELTGVPTSNNNVKNVFSDVKINLPTDNEMKAFLSGHQVALTKLAAEFCNEMVNNVTLRQNLWTDANFNMAKDTAFNQIRKDELANKSMDLFWGPVVSIEDKADMRLVINDLIDDLMIGESNNTTITREIVKSVCTATLSSMHVTVK